MATLTTIQGDATKPDNLGEVPIIIAHCCNDIFLWGAGFVLAIDRAFGQKPHKSYLNWRDSDGKSVKITGTFGLGQTQFVKLPNKVVIANMIGQHGVRVNDPSGRPPIRYGAIVNCMRAVADVAKKAKAEIHCPRFGSDLSGGSWETIKLLIFEEWVDAGISVTEYEFPKS